MGGLGDRFGTAVGIELDQNGGDVKFDGVEGNSKSARDCFVGGTICHRREHFKFAGRQWRIPVIAYVELLAQKWLSMQQRGEELPLKHNKPVGDRPDCGDYFP